MGFAVRTIFRSEELEEPSALRAVTLEDAEREGRLSIELMEETETVMVCC